ncbi:hypothetical protein MXB_1045, partial [Myxobolus squamalis]
MPGALKTFELYLDESDCAESKFTKIGLSCIVMSPKIVDQFVNHFNTICEEITLSTNTEGVKLKNYTLSETGIFCTYILTDTGKSVRTEITFTAEEFDQYDVKCACDVTFCLKDFRALMPFLLPMSLMLHVYFDDSGKYLYVINLRPIIVSATDPLFEIDLVLSTVLVPGQTNCISLGALNSAHAPLIV